jgi:hypothetical protein
MPAPTQEKKGYRDDKCQKQHEKQNSFCDDGHGFGSRRWYRPEVKRGDTHLPDGDEKTSYHSGTGLQQIQALQGQDWRNSTMKTDAGDYGRARCLT